LEPKIIPFFQHLLVPQQTANPMAIMIMLTEGAKALIRPAYQ